MMGAHWAWRGVAGRGGAWLGVADGASQGQPRTCAMTAWPPVPQQRRDVTFATRFRPRRVYVQPHIVVKWSVNLPHFEPLSDRPLLLL